MLLSLCLSVKAQINGRVVDANGYAIPYASVAYKGHQVAVSSDVEGRFTIERHNGWVLTISSLGFKSQAVKVDNDTKNLEIKLKEDSHKLDEVVVKSRRGKYSRKDNPAVELMRRVIAAKKKTDLQNHDYYQYDKYQKLTMAVNDIKPEQLENGFFKKRQYLIDQVEVSPYNNKLTLPLSVDETVTQHLYRKNPHKERDIIKGQQSTGIGNILQTGDVINTTLKELFTDVDIYDDHVRLLQYPFPSPIGRTAISFYHFYIEDTVYVDRDLCYHLQFIPANSQDFGFRGELYVLADSSLHVKRCNLFMPHNSDVNWVDNMKIEQEYTKLDNGEWVLTKDDMVAELSITNYLSKLLVVRNTRLSDYQFAEISHQLLRGKALVKHDAEAMNRDESFWKDYRSVDLTKSESSMNQFIHRLENSKGWKWIIVSVRALMENYVETGKKDAKSKFDFGPINTFLSKNYVDGIRLRLAGRTMAALNPHFFWNGYGAYGTDSKRWYYGSEFTYSFNKKKSSSFEFPQRNIIFESSKDVMSPSDKNLLHNKDNIFMTFRASTQKEMYLFNRQKLSFVYETDWGFSFRAGVKTESNETVGDLHYWLGPSTANMKRIANGRVVGREIKKIRMSEVSLGFKYHPGVTYVNTKQQRLPINLDSPEFWVVHRAGFKHFLGGQYNSNITELGFYKRQWLGSWGYVDIHAKGEAQWNKVPFPLLVLPPINLSYFEHENTFNLMRDWEFLNDRQLFWAVCWDMNGKLLNRIPLVKRLKWREYFALKGMMGTLTSKNNPDYDDNLFRFPTGAHRMDGQPYWEAVAGVHNIFKFFSMEYVRRLSYLHNEKIDKWGIRFGFDMTF